MSDDDVVGLCEFRRGFGRSQYMLHGEYVKRVYELAGRDASGIRTDVFYHPVADFFYDVIVPEARACVGEKVPSWMAL